MPSKAALQWPLVYLWEMKGRNVSFNDISIRWIKYKYGTLVEWYWLGNTKTELLGEKHVTNILSLFNPQGMAFHLYLWLFTIHHSDFRAWLGIILIVAREASVLAVFLEGHEHYLFLKLCNFYMQVANMYVDHS